MIISKHPKQKKTEGDKLSLWQYVSKIAKKELVDDEQIKEIIINAFKSSYSPNKTTEIELELEFSDELLVYRKYKIVTTVNDEEKEILFKDAEKKRK